VRRGREWRERGRETERREGKRRTLKEGGETGEVNVLRYGVHNLDQELSVGGVSKEGGREVVVLMARGEAHDPIIFRAPSL